MRNFSIISSWDRDPIDQYTDFLTNEVYKSTPPLSHADTEDPLFLQKLGILRAASIQKAIETNGSVMYYGQSETNETVRQSTHRLSLQLGASASIITSSLDRGFIALNHSLEYIGGSIDATNNHLTNLTKSLGGINSNLKDTNKILQTLGRATTHGLAVLHRDFSVLHQDMENNTKLQLSTNEKLSNIHKSLNAITLMSGQGFSNLYNQLSLSNTLLDDISNELKIPETQRERRYHIEEGTKFLSMALADNDKLYFDDAISEFKKVIDIECKDFFSWYNLGLIYLRSTHFFDIKKATDAFERYIHYAKAEIVQRNNKKIENQLDNVYLMMAEIKYLQQSPIEAVSFTEKCKCLREKADFMKSKYLSATHQHKNQMIAAEILHDQLDKNPLLSLQILEDNDLITNSYITQLLESLRQITLDKAIKSWQEFNNRISEYIREISCYNNEINSSCKMIGTTAVLPIVNADFSEELCSIKSLINRSTYLESVEALGLIESLNNKLEEKWDADRTDYKNKRERLNIIADSFLLRCISIDKEITNSLQQTGIELESFERLIKKISDLVSSLSDFNSDLRCVLDGIYYDDYSKELKFGGNLSILNEYHNSFIKNDLYKGALWCYCSDSSNTVLAKITAHYNYCYARHSNNIEIFKKCKEEQVYLQGLQNNHYETLSDRFKVLKKLEDNYNALLQTCIETLKNSSPINSNLQPEYIDLNKLKGCRCVMRAITSKTFSPYPNPSLFSLHKRKFNRAVAEFQIISQKAKNINSAINSILKLERYH